MNENEPKPEQIEKLNAKVLLADDSFFELRMTSKILESMGCTVETVRDGQELVDRLSTAQPGEFDLIITDRNMPRMNGVEALERLHTDEHFKSLNCPIILNSTDAEEQDITAVGKYGGVYLHKKSRTSNNGSNVFMDTVRRLIKG
ncbi:MAG: response regulator [Candidatus Pacebacteria bacterium]|nr:response regulator [Candidatus Paceibacterota bacterium]